MFQKSHELSAQVQEFYEENVVLCFDRDMSLKRLAQMIRLVKKGRIEQFIFDTETTGFNMFSGTSNYYNKYTERVEVVDGVRVFMYQFGFTHPKSEKLYCVWVDCEDKEGMILVREALAIRKVTIIGHNLKYDYQVCYAEGLTIQGIIWDTLSATCLTHNRLLSHSLKYLTRVFIGNSGACGDEDRWEKEVKDWLSKAKGAHTRAETKRYKEEKFREATKLEKADIKEYVNYSFVPNSIMIKYALLDIWNTYLIHFLVEDEIEENYAPTFNLEIKIVNLVMKMERRGMRIDPQTCQKGYHRLTTYERILAHKVHVGGRDIGWFDFNPGSPKQMMKYLKEHLKVPDNLLIGKKGKACTEKKVLEDLVEFHGYEHSMLGDIVALRGVQRLRITYFRNILKRSAGDNILNPNIKPSETKTGRAASANPALQNIPRPGSIVLHNVPSVRSCFIPREGYVNYYMDYAQIEMVVFALFCQDPDLLKAVRAGEDLHTATAQLMFGMKTFNKDPKKYRQDAKKINFGIVYGMGTKALAKDLNISLSAAIALMDKYFDRFPGIKEIQKVCKKLLRKQGWVEDMFGRRYHVEPDKAYVAVNALTQGAAANILKLAMIQVDNLINKLNLSKEVCILMTIHDELMIEVADTVDPIVPYLIKLAMESIAPITRYDIHPTVDIEFTTTHWEDKHLQEVCPKLMKKAQKQFKLIAHDVLEPYSDRMVDWFTSDWE